jgi:zinc transport system ATP-binding protein
MKILEVKNLDVFRGGKKILEDVSFSLERGEVLGILGPNGGGKSTLVQAIAQLIPFSQGIVWMAEGERLGYVPQFANFDEEFPITVAEVVLSGSMYFSKRKRMASGDDVKARDLIKQFSLSDVAEHSISDLSGGQTQRVLICRALMGDPTILLMDEPTASIDFNTKDQIIRQLRDKKPEMSIVLVSHDLNVINQTVGSILCVNFHADFHPSNQLESNELKKVYGCPIEVILHGEIPHRVLGGHHGKGEDLL